MAKQTFETEHKTLVAKNSSLEEQVKDLKEQLATHRAMSQVEQHRQAAEMPEDPHARQQLQDWLDNLEEENVQVGISKAALSAEYESLKQQLTATCKDYQQRLDFAMTSQEKLRQTKADLQQQLNIALARISDLENRADDGQKEEIRDLQIQLSRAKTKISDLEEQNLSLSQIKEEARSALNSRIALLKQQTESHKKTLQDMETYKSRVTRQINHLTSENSELQQALNQLKDSARSIVSPITSTTSPATVKVLTKGPTAYDSFRETLSKENQELERECGEISARAAAFGSSVQTLSLDSTNRSIGVTRARSEEPYSSALRPHTYYPSGEPYYEPKGVGMMSAVMSINEFIQTEQERGRQTKKAKEDGSVLF